MILPSIEVLPISKPTVEQELIGTRQTSYICRIKLVNSVN